MRDRCHLDRLAGEVDAVAQQPVDYRSECVAQIRLRQVGEGQPRPARRRTAARVDFAADRVCREVAGRRVPAAVLTTVPVDELFHRTVEQPAAELVPKRIPHDGVHADESRREVADREELDELHVDEGRARAQCKRIAFARHVVRCARTGVELGESPGCDHGRPGFDTDLRAVAERESERPAHRALLHHQVGDRDIAERADAAGPPHPLAQGARHRRPGVQEIDVAAAPAAVSGGHHLTDVTVRARPADAPVVHLAHPLGRGPATALRPAIRRTAHARPRGCPRGGLPQVSGSCSASAAATVICAITVAPPRPIMFLSARMTPAPARAAASAAYMPAPPAPTTRTSVERCIRSGDRWCIACIVLAVERPAGRVRSDMRYAHETAP